MKLLIPAVVLFGLLTFLGLSSLRSSSVTTALDRVSPSGRVTGRVHSYGYGWPFLYMSKLEYREQQTGSPDAEDVESVRQAAEDMLSADDGAPYDRTQVRRYHWANLSGNVLTYLLFSAGVTWIAWYLIASVFSLGGRGQE